MGKTKIQNAPNGLQETVVKFHSVHFNSGASDNSAKFSCQLSNFPANAFVKGVQATEQNMQFATDEQSRGHLLEPLIEVELQWEPQQHSD